MVEDRMKAAIQAIGSAWYTAWVNAGQPDLSQLSSTLPLAIEKEGVTMKQKVHKKKSEYVNMKIRHLHDTNFEGRNFELSAKLWTSGKCV